MAAATAGTIIVFTIDWRFAIGTSLLFWANGIGRKIDKL